MALPEPIKSRASIAAIALLTGISGACNAQQTPDTAAPSTAAIVDALKPATRSSRNLIVSPPDAAAPANTPGGISSPPLAASGAPAAAPSISMAIQFDFDSARLRAESLGALDNLAAALTSADLRANRFLVEGHTDATGASGYNLRLSEQRAAEVKRYLVAHGVGSERVAVVGRGSTQPADAEHPAAAGNRRVRIVNVD
jgi:outer membrane protein OmpA-like peptidoglycan-associated protein